MSAKRNSTPNGSKTPNLDKIRRSTDSLLRHSERTRRRLQQARVNVATRLALLAFGELAGRIEATRPEGESNGNGNGEHNG